MKIINNRKTATVAFKSFADGECFLDLEGNLFIKAEEDYEINAVNLFNGELSYFGDETKVYPVKASIVVDE